MGDCIANFKTNCKTQLVGQAVEECDLSVISYIDASGQFCDETVLDEEIIQY